MGPYTSIGPRCRIERCEIENSIVLEGSSLEGIRGRIAEYRKLHAAGLTGADTSVWLTDQVPAYLEPGRAARLVRGSLELGWFGEVAVAAREIGRASCRERVSFLV